MMSIPQVIAVKSSPISVIMSHIDDYSKLDGKFLFSVRRMKHREGSRRILMFRVSSRTSSALVLQSCSAARWLSWCRTPDDSHVARDFFSALIQFEFFPLAVKTCKYKASEWIFNRKIKVNFMMKTVNL